MRKVATGTNNAADIIGGNSFRIDVVTVLACIYTGDTATFTQTSTLTYLA